jgi:hypothetical protein
MMKASRRVGLLGIFTVLLGFVVVMPSWALTIDPDLCQGNHTGSCPTDPWDWMTAEITGSGTLTMTMTGHFASGSDNRITNWWFNLDPEVVPTGAILTITQTSSDPLVDKVNSAAAVSGNPFTVTISQNSQSVDGGGAFDLEFNFFDGPPAKRFNGSDVLTFTIACSFGCVGVFDDTVFDFSSTVPPGGNTAYIGAPGSPHEGELLKAPFRTIASINPAGHFVAGVAPDSVPTAVPAPMSLVLLGSGIFGLGVLGRRRFSR